MFCNSLNYQNLLKTVLNFFFKCYLTRQQPLRWNEFPMKTRKKVLVFVRPGGEDVRRTGDGRDRRPKVGQCDIVEFVGIYRAGRRTPVVHLLKVGTYWPSPRTGFNQRFALDRCFITPRFDLTTLFLDREAMVVYFNWF